MKQFFVNVFKFVCGIMILAGAMGLLAYYTNNSHAQDTETSPALTGQEVPALNKDDNLTNLKPTPRWRLNVNGYSQRYIPLTSEGRENRMRELLSHYDKAPAYEVRQVIARVYRVYPEALICIAYADTSLGNFLKTPNNIGNVGNNDRGGTQSQRSPEAGVNAIGKTLTNQYLGDKITIGDLSYAGDCSTNCEKVYATSNENRQVNVLNCMGMIRNKEVPANFAFRW